MISSLQSGAVLTWFHDPPSRGPWNMALDEALLHRAVQGGPPTLRFYEWNEPTLSLGYFQDYADRDTHSPSTKCAVVRRSTGGGALLHDRELTYGITLPPGHPLGRRAGDLYLAIHESIVAVLSTFGPTAQIYDCDRSKGAPGCAANEPAVDQFSASPMAAEPFLCFERRTTGDVLIDGRKIVGSAQRRHRGAVLQHGSILFERSPFAPELPGIQDLANCRLDTRDFSHRMRSALSAGLGFDLELSPHSAEIMDRAKAIEASKFAADHWLRLR